MKILVVDDDPVGLLVASTVVESLGHAVTAARDGEQAWRLLAGGVYDVVVSDREMPGLGGLELCRRLRGPGSATDRPYTYIVLVTGHDGYAQALEGMQAGADDYLGKPLSAAELRLRLTAAQRVTDLHRTLERQQRELSALNDAQHELARRDALTGLPNRRALQEELDRLDARAQRYGHSYHLALFDVDHFKGYNDTAGHAAGDQALHRIAQALAGQVRQVDGLYRYGGEEFVHVLDTDSPEGALAAVERLRVAVHQLGLPHPGRQDQPVTVSVGLAGITTGRSSSHALLAAADSALYEAKRLGRNQVRPAPQPRTTVTQQAGQQHNGAPPDPVLPGPVPPEPVQPVPVLLDPAPLQALHTLGGQVDRDLAEEVVRAFVSSSADQLAALRAALRARTADALHRGAHALRGSSATVGATALSRLCAQLETEQLWPRAEALVEELHALTEDTSGALHHQLQALLSA